MYRSKEKRGVKRPPFITEWVCEAQRGEVVSVEWCDLAQYEEFCGDCEHSQNLKRSKWQESKEKKERHETHARAEKNDHDGEK